MAIPASINGFHVTRATTAPRRPLFGSDDDNNNIFDELEDVVLPEEENVNGDHSVFKNGLSNPEKKMETGDYDNRRRGMELVWCSSELCREEIRERVVGEDNHMEFEGPATGQVAYFWKEDDDNEKDKEDDGDNDGSSSQGSETIAPSVLLLVRKGDDDLLKVAGDAIPELTEAGVKVLLAPDLCAKVKHYFGVDDSMIGLFEPNPAPGFGGDHVASDDALMGDSRDRSSPHHHQHETFSHPDLVCTLGGDGLLMYAGMMFPGPVPPILCIAGGSLGFLTPFPREEMVQAILISLGKLENQKHDPTDEDIKMTRLEARPPFQKMLQRTPSFSVGVDKLVCLSMRMRLDVRVINREGVVRARFNVLNEVVIDRGGSPYLANLECFCDDVHLTTVQADGVIFAT